MRARTLTVYAFVSCAACTGRGSVPGSEQTASSSTATTGLTETTGLDPTSTTGLTETTGLDPTSTTGLTEPGTTGGQASTGTSTTGPDPNGIGVCEPDTLSDCDILRQGPDCPEGKCVAAYSSPKGTWLGTVCTASAGPGRGRGEPCRADPTTCQDDCAIGLQCWAWSDQEDGYCVSYCGAGTLDCAPSDNCAESGNGNLPPLCLPSCDPVTQDCPGSNEVCRTGIWFGSGFSCMPGAWEPGDASQGESCDSGCRADHICVPRSDYPSCTNEKGCCAELCDIGNGSCGVGSCRPWPVTAQLPPDGWEYLGICLP